MRLEGPHDLKGLGEDVNTPIVTAHKEVVGTRTNAAQIIALAMSALKQTVLVEGLTDIEDRGAFPVAWQNDFGNVEEVEDFPLKMAYQYDERRDDCNKIRTEVKAI